MVLDPWVKDIPADAILSPVKFGKEIKEPTMTEQPAVKTKFPLGTEVQLKSIPGFGYSVIAAVKNERSLMALDGSCLGMALVHEIEPYCDVDQAHFVSKASMVLWNLGVQDASELASKALYKAGARFPDAGSSKAVHELTDLDVTVMIGNVSRKLMAAEGYTKIPQEKVADAALFDIWHTKPDNRYHRFVQLAIEVVSMVTSIDTVESVHQVYPHPNEEI